MFVSGASDRKIAAFPAADDLLALIGRDIALSTAASLSARFPLVLPPGTLVDSASQSHGRVVDGGYFENFGAVTAAEVVAEVRRALGADAASVHPVVILISSDPSLPNTLGAPCNRPKENGGLGESSAARCPVNEIEYAPEVRSPLRAFSKTRQTRGILAALNLEAMAADIGGEFVTFRLCPADPTAESDGGDPPLGWALSAFAKAMIDGQFTDLDGKEDACRRINRESWEAIYAVFGATNRLRSDYHPSGYRPPERTLLRRPSHHRQDPV